MAQGTGGGSNVFASDIQTETRPSKIDKDHLPPQFGRLNAEAMVQPNALAGPPDGAEQVWVMGTQTAHITQNRVTLVDVNENHTVFGTQTETVHQQATLDYLNGRDVAVGVQDTLNVKGDQDIAVLGQSNETYLGHHEVHAPSEFELKAWEGGLTLAETKSVLGSLTVRGTEVCIKAQDHEFAAVKTGTHEFADTWFTQKGEVAALHTQVGAAADASPLVNAGLELGPGHIP